MSTARRFMMRSGGDAASILTIYGESQYVGKNFILTAKYGDRTVYPTWAIIAGNEYATINSNGKISITQGAQNDSITVQASYTNSLGTTTTETKVISVTYDNELSIDGPSTMKGTAGNVFARYNGSIVTPTWSITTGSQYATIAADGSIAILESGTIAVTATYSGYTTTKTIELIYEANTVTEVEIDEDTGTTTTTTTTTTENQDGSTTTNTTTTVVNSDGSGSETISNTTELEDGSSTITSNTINSDGTSQHSDTNVNIDGSSTNTTTNYNADGDPVSGSNNKIDTDGNSSTQTVIYDSEGGTTVTGYTIDTSGNEEGEKPFNADGVNTEYYAFDMTHGFVLDFNFTIDLANQPPNQNENHHNILTMKRATPSPWYGFQLRQTSTTKSIILGTQFARGGNTNTTIAPMTTTGTVAEYNLKIIYDPTASTNKFMCFNANTGAEIFSKNDTFPDIPELRYLKMTIGYAMDANGNPYRYSNINVKNFSIQRT